jgi:uncharacterized protein (TIGR03032 family)
MTKKESTTSSPEPKLEITGSRQLTSWMVEQRISLVFSTYQTGKLFLIGLQPDGRLSIFERTFDRCMGVRVDNSANTIYISTLYQIWRLENALAQGQLHNGYDKLYVPQISYVTGDIDTHDIAIDKNGRVIFVNTLFSCLATTCENASFTPIWKPKFISKLAAEDRCHLNGLAMENGEPKYVTTVAQTDINEGWRDHREKGGTVIDVASNEIVMTGLSMPHSPRLYQDKLWVLNSGTGHFGYVDVNKGKFEEVAFCPGYLRGLDFIGDFAIIGLSTPRDNKTFAGLPLDENIKNKKTVARCGFEIVDLRSGDVVHTLFIEGIISELYDVAVLPNVQRPMALGFKTEEIRRTITLGAPATDFATDTQ